MVRWHQGDTRRAKDMFNRALNIDAAHGPSKEAMSQL
jgi:Tfp pilus assembly protein PilF